MSMNYFEFIRQLGTDPAARDPAFLRARESSPEFIRAAAESDRFERSLSRALTVTPPPDLLAGLKGIADVRAAGVQVWRRYAVAAGLLLAVAAAGIIWRINPAYDSVEQYVAHHYRHDGRALVTRGAGKLADNVDEVLTRFHVTMTPETRRMVEVIKYCPTPGGEGAHMVLNTEQGPITVIFMPETAVTDGEMLEFDGMEAQLVVLTVGSAAVIGSQDQRVTAFHQLVQNAFIPLDAEV